MDCIYITRRYMVHIISSWHLNFNTTSFTAILALAFRLSQPFSMPASIKYSLSEFTTRCTPVPRSSFIYIDRRFFFTWRRFERPNFLSRKSKTSGETTHSEFRKGYVVTLCCTSCMNRFCYTTTGLAWLLQALIQSPCTLVRTTAQTFPALSNTWISLPQSSEDNTVKQQHQMAIYI